MAKINLNALLQAAKGKQRSPRRVGPKMTIKSSGTVQFVSKGKVVKFKVTGKRKAERQAKLGEYQRYVADNIGKYIPPGGGKKQAQAAMKKVVADWNKRKSRRAA